ncbi:MAG: endonuclease/exonuclease/phosphatase family protein [Candidatus Beckwithbacteria bacterium]
MNFSVLQWNVWFKENPDRIIKEIKRMDPDVICGQELIQLNKNGKKVDTAKYIANKLGYEYFYKEAETWSNREEKDNQGNAIFSRLPIKQTKFVYIQEPKHNPSDASHEGRVYVEIDDHRKKEVDNLLQIIEGKNKGYIFTGDLNSLPGSYSIEKLKQLKNVAHVGPDYQENTFANKPFDYHGYKVDNLSLRLDYIYISRDLKVESVEIVKTNVSDHLPILVKFNI